MIEPALTNPVVLDKKCANHIRGCRKILEADYTRTKCEDCLRKDRERDKKRREEAKVKQQKSTEGETSRKCTTCCQEYPLEQFRGLRENTLTKTCQKCRESNKINDARRDKEHRNELARICSKKPEQIARKKEWVENNYDKCVEAWQKHRQTRIENDTEEYLQKNAENAKRWRENNPEKTKETVEKVKNSVDHQYTTYKRSAFYKNLEFGLNIEQFENIVTQPCYYCGEFTKGCCINGIDRKESSGPYNICNTVTCCKMCNMMKNTLNEYTFLKQIEHILTFQNLIPDGKLYSEIFSNYRGCSLNDYKIRASEKKLDFELDVDDYTWLVMENCYICGKPSSKTHINGIDRYDNKHGYVKNNCKSCCANCNYIKRDNNYDEFIQKLLQIHQNHKDDLFDNTQSNRCLEQSNKLSKEEMKQHSQQTRESRIIQLKEKYTPEEIKKNAVRLAESRKSKQISTVDNNL